MMGYCSGPFVCYPFYLDRRKLLCIYIYICMYIGNRHPLPLLEALKSWACVKSRGRNNDLTEPASSKSGFGIPKGSKYQHKKTLGFLYRRLLIWRGPGTHYWSTWTLWHSFGSATSRAYRRSIVTRGFQLLWGSASRRASEVPHLK